MNEEQKRLLARLELKSNEELASILRERDEEQWRPEVFETAAAVLTARGVSPEDALAMAPESPQEHLQEGPQEPPRKQRQERSQEQLERAGFGRRALARAIDLAIHYGVAFFVTIVAVVVVSLGAALRGEPAGDALAGLSATTPLTYLAAMLGALMMHTLSEGLHGSTLGKWICGMVVVGEDGSPATIASALKRSVAFYWDGLFFGMVAYQSMAGSPRGQRYGDVWGRTMVLRTSALPPSARRSWLRFAGAAVAGLAADGFILMLEIASRFI
jgi:uncharacterized RDD family membrane protein YckC